MPICSSEPSQRLHFYVVASIHIARFIYLSRHLMICNGDVAPRSARQLLAFVANAAWLLPYSPTSPAISATVVRLFYLSFHCCAWLDFHETCMYIFLSIPSFLWEPMSSRHLLLIGAQDRNWPPHSLPSANLPPMRFHLAAHKILKVVEPNCVF
jgi:hypothetical protein